ncbi:MAG: hypothetical protein K2J79_05310 [Ruminiclostridium sp.]|nr:hypothetical protein [Ruminiclostridium sp.]
MKYWIERWSILRKKELMFYPDRFPVNDVYGTLCTWEELKKGFDELHEIFARCYDDMINNPTDMGLPLYDMNEYGYFSKEARSSREESYKYARIFYVLGYTGELNGDGELRVHSDALKEQCKSLKITNIGAFLNKLGNYGITVEGLVKGKVKSNTEIYVSFPDNGNVIKVLYILAVKAHGTNRFKDFCRLNYRLFEGDWDTAEYDKGVDAVSDLFHREKDRETSQLIHEELIRRGYRYNFQEWNEGPQIRYYRKEADRNRNTNADFWLACIDTELRFYFRIRHIDKALDYIKSCPDSVIESFLVSDNGCGNRVSGSCTSGIAYELKGRSVWRCGCCNPNFQVAPDSENYLFYINAVEAAIGNDGKYKHL